ncbi:MULTISPECIES: ABC transporter ATP-binding protein [Streptomyces]|uniref:ABC transporter ATP-binding protein n=1 Tax=Streptomyces TaxID=1883 RepID=UPI0029AD7893|nr:ABC transporter ATP-binding protein [Streptomyces stelliscabiei]MDX2514641.1 ABC transporter ATP-binding protein [Streptomyces stelliscabiei]MDX2661201.1 ABC transporter ATP-binding protein [Streptomyces stelliscabiei]MDX2790178.1 ABC transporter ATP-binding protein [Streptomyces stelliscabiei]
MDGVSFRALCARIPSVMKRIAGMSWAVDRAAVVLLLVCQVTVGLAAAGQLTATSKVMRSVLGDGTVQERLHQALPALIFVAVMAALSRTASAVSAYGDRRITPKLTTEADTALVSSVCQVEAAAYSEDGFHDRQEAAEMGVIRTHVMVADAQQLMSSLIQLVTACGVLAVLDWRLLPFLLLAVLPAGIGSVLTARVDYEIHYANIANRNARGMMRWWATSPKYGDEVRANSMAGYLLYWYRTLSQQADERSLAAAPRILRINLASAACGGLFLVATWAALYWLAATGQIAVAIAATVVFAVRTTLGALTQLVRSAAAVFHTSLYLGDMTTFLDEAKEKAPHRGELTVRAPIDEVCVQGAVYRYPGKDKPAVDGVSLTLRRGQILALVGVNGSGKTTLTRLLAGILLADKGTVTWNGTDLAEVDPDTVWALTGLVPQVFAQWPLRLRENVNLGQPRPGGDVPVWEAIDAVGLREAVEDLPDQLDTLLAREIFSGVELSGGQWQRVACARGLHRLPELLIMDEPTSQVDPEGEHRAFETLKAMAADRITIVVTHRLENTKIADEIVVMEEGRVTEHGTYEDLAAGGGTFARLLALSQDR